MIENNQSTSIQIHQTRTDKYIYTIEIPLFQLSNVVNLSLVVLNHLREQECKCTQTDLQKAKHSISLYGKEKDHERKQTS
jgi:hypothetical protein